MSQAMYKIVGATFTLFNFQLEIDYPAPRPPFVDALINSLRADIDLLFKTWSLMAARNILTSIERSLILAESQLAPESKRLAIKLKQTVARVLGEQSLAKARYDSVLLCGYHKKTTAPEFTGHAWDDYADMQDRADEMKQAIVAAHANVDATHQADDRMLKIFMAPEFFFRGMNGGYDAEDVAGLAPRADGQTTIEISGKRSLIEILQEEISKPQYKHWLFVLGTVIVLTKSVETRCTENNCKGTLQITRQDGLTTVRCSASTADHPHDVREVTLGATVDNVALICKEQWVHAITKELVSDADFITSTIFDSGGKVLRRIKDEVTTIGGEILKVRRSRQTSGFDAASDMPSAFQDERMGGCIFTLDGITFGCEICLDHDATSQKSSAGRLANASGIQIQLIPSGGMRTSQFRTVPNGVVFNVDGRTPHVQAVGLKGPNGIGVDEELAHGRLQAKLKGWDTKRMEALLDVEFGESEPEWSGSSAKAPAKAPGGSIVEFGPYEIPRP
jgi:hypothetical protein